MLRQEIVGRHDCDMRVLCAIVGERADRVPRCIFRRHSAELNDTVAVDLDLLARWRREPELTKAPHPLVGEAVGVDKRDRHPACSEDLLKLALEIAMVDPRVTVEPRVDPELRW
jgi:hypothetical protein